VIVMVSNNNNEMVSRVVLFQVLYAKTSVFNVILIEV